MAWIDGKRWSEFLNGTDYDDEIHGFEGDDWIFGGGGDDTIRGDAGNDVIFGESGNDNIQGGSGDDLLMGEGGDDTIVATNGVDEIEGGSGNDDITVEGGDWFRFDRVDGGSGNDAIEVRADKVLAFGGTGDDTFYTDLGLETVLVGGQGNDRFVLTADGWGSGRAAELHGGDAAVVTTSAFGIESISTVTLLGDTSEHDKLDLSQLEGYGTLSVNMATGTIKDEDGVLWANFDGIEDVIGSSDSDFVIGSDVGNMIDARGGDDVVYGFGGDDVIYGAAGKDTILGGTGQDFLWGEAGNDTLYGDSNADYLYGGAGSDKLFGGSGADTIYGDYYGDAVAADTLTGGTGADRFVFVSVANNVTATQIATRSGGTMYQLNISPIFDTITDFDTSGADHDTIDVSYIMQTKVGFGGTFQQAVDQGYLYFVQHGTPGQADFGTTVMIDANGGTHGDALNNYGVADLKGILQAEVVNRADLFLV